MQNLIEIKNLTFQYDSDEVGKKAVLKDINLFVQKGSFVVVLGHNGSGKSTLAKLMNGMLKPDSGTVLVDGINTLDQDTDFEVRRKVGLVFQNPDNQIICSIVEEDVAFGPENLGVEPAEIRKRVDNALKSVGMSEYRLAAPYKLSGGQKQRVAIAGVLAMEPECIILDEPTAMLDPVGRKEVLKTITELNQKKGMTVVLITHFMDEAENADRVLVMNKGLIVADGTPKEVFSNIDLIESASLALPQSTELLSKLSEMGYKFKSHAISCDAVAEDLYSSLFMEGVK